MIANRLPALVVLCVALIFAGCERTEAPVPTPVEEQAAGPGAAASASGPEADAASCVTYDSAYARAPLMRVRGAADSQLRFQDRAEACPASGACEWRRDGYVIGGDLVLASAEVNGFRCVYAPATGGDLAAGFLPATELEPAAADAEPLTPDFLVGRWRHLGENEIAFARTGGGLAAAGSATYDSGTPGGVNTGEFKGPITLVDDAARYADESCTVTARRRGPFLVVEDNNGCGGMNVSFGGIYSRASS